jgi:hypothetical protein
MDMSVDVNAAVDAAVKPVVNVGLDIAGRLS